MHYLKDNNKGLHLCPNVESLDLYSDAFIVTHIYQKTFINCIECQGTGQVTRFGGTPLTCECSAAKLK